MSSSVDLFFSGGVKALQWYGSNKHSHVKKNSFSSLKPQLKEQQLKNLDATLQKIILAFAKRINKETTQLLIKYLNGRIKKYGSCHGKCLLVIERLLKSPKLTCKELFSGLTKEDSQRVAYLQSLEIIRGHLHLSLPGKEAEVTHHTIETQYFPAANKTAHYTDKDFKQFFDDLSKIKNEVWQIRTWNEKKTTAHSLLYCCSEDRKQFWFYNSDVGLFSFDNSKELSHHFSNHIHVFLSSNLKSGGHMFVNQFQLP